MSVSHRITDTGSLERIPKDDIEVDPSKMPYEEREHWAKWWEFVLSLIGYSVGLGNIWRFPYLCYKHGGGAFLIPYFIFLLFAGVPMLMLEVSIGQFMQLGGIEAWSLAPIMKGIGYAAILISFYLNCYYIVVLAWTFHYFGNSFKGTLPWSNCDNYWNTENCFNPFNNTDNLEETTDPTVEYWQNRVLKISSGIDEPGSINYELLLCLIGAWTLCFMCTFKGVHLTGKVVYFTALFPYVVLVIILIRGVTLDGASDGIYYYLHPDLDRLKSAEIWKDAGTQIFFSCSIGLGSLVSLGSYNRFKQNCMRDMAIYAAINSMTSFVGGFAIFSILGFMAHEQNVHISVVAESGPGLLFIAFPKAITRMPLPQLWSILFFFMVILLGIDSMFVNIEGDITSVVDLFPAFFKRGKYRREFFVFLHCFVCFLIGISMVTEGGMYVFQLFDNFAASGMALLAVAFFECVAISWVYGFARDQVSYNREYPYSRGYYHNIKRMLHGVSNYKFWTYFMIPIVFSWYLITPLMCLGVFIFLCLFYEPLLYNNTYRYPDWGYAIGWLMASSSMAIPPLYALYTLVTCKGDYMALIRPVFKSPHFEYYEVFGKPPSKKYLHGKLDDGSTNVAYSEGEDVLPDYRDTVLTDTKF